jgi:hypothetical protein
MTKRRLLTLAVLAATLALAMLRRGAAPAHTPVAPPGPEDTVYAMFNAARDGQVKAYLAVFADPMLASLRQALAEATVAEFANNLRAANAGVKGIAVSGLT